ncbi:SLBB domain-containing protein [Flavobacteriaceae bacterium]|nr:SLBB domain-containing protein [Flavobacteriaceae bacterium]
MRLIYIFILFSFFGFSQTNEVLINQALQTAESQNITTQAQAIQALAASGMTETQARQLAAQRGISYDELLNDYFSDEINIESIADPDTSILDEASISDVKEVTEEIDNINEALDKTEEQVYFGYNIFENNPYLNKEYLLGNIDEGYLIAPGDELRIMTYGDNSFEQNVTVDRNGNININGYGLFFASGNSFKTLKSRLKVFLGKYLSGLVSNPEKTFMDVSLTQLRPVKVVVLGQVNAPGPHILNTSGSALSALYAAGGVKTNGTLREIKIYRNNKLFKTIDLYDYITKGQLKEDVRLTNNDIVFVDTRKNSISMEGEIYNSAIYELTKNESLDNLIDYSGGLPATAQTTKVNISRITPADKRTNKIVADRELITINFQERLRSSKKIILLDGDKITFFPILDLEVNKVTILGHVYEPGDYSLSTFKNLRSLILNAAKGVKPEVYPNKVDVTSLINGNEGTQLLNSYNLSDIISGKKDVVLQDLDEVRVYSNLEIEGSKTVSISGYGIFEDVENDSIVSVTNIDKTISWKENLSIYDLIFSSTEINNPEFLADLLKSRIDIKRYNNETGGFNNLKFEFNNLEQLKNTILLPRDEVILYSINITENLDKSVGIYGSVKNANEFRLEENMYVEDLILLAGGFLINSDQNTVIVNRLDLDVENERITRKYEVSVDKDYLLGLKEEPNEKFILNDKDLITVKQILGYQEPVNISITGEVNFPQNVVIEFKNTNFKQILGYVGGLTKYANLDASVLKRDGKVIVLDFSKLNKTNTFENGDEIFIASNKGIVSTLGAVQNESNFIWFKGLRAKSYIKNSGGKISKESSNSFIRYPNGRVSKINFFTNPKVLPNSLIITNRKLKKDKKDGAFLEGFTSTFGLIASTITTILLASKL